jgi:hypothetical protein
MSCKPHNAYVVSTPAAAPAVDAEEGGSGADKDHARVEQLNAYIRSLKHHITGQKQLFHNCMLESSRKSERIGELQQYIQGLEETRGFKSERIGELQERVQILLKNERIHEQKMLEKEKIHEWMKQDLLSQLRQARESHEKQLAGWMEQVNALQTRIHMLERRSTVMCPSLRR